MYTFTVLVVSCSMRLRCRAREVPLDSTGISATRKLFTCTRRSIPQRRDARPDVSGIPEGVEAGWNESDAAVCLRRIQHQHEAGLQLLAAGDLGAGICLCFGQS